MKPVGLVTCYYHHNYGSMLQAYATEMIMLKMGIPYNTIACKCPKVYMQSNVLLYFVKKLLIGDWKMWLGKQKIAKEARKSISFKESLKKRNLMFDEFANNYFHLSQLAQNRTDLEYMAYDYSAFLVGSDQLWRTDSVEHGYFTLEWVPDNIRKIAYSTSIGVKKIPWFQRKKNSWFMNRFDFVALREQSACDIFHSLTGKTVQVVLDPTLLFTGTEWMEIQHKEPLTNSAYIFVYLLGNNPNQREYIKKVRDSTGCKIVALLHLDNYIPSDNYYADETPYDVGPKEFLNYVRNAKYIFTDSFHCSVFSILYHKNFFTFNRFAEGAKQSTNTRIDNLLHITGLEERRWNTSKSVKQAIELKSDYLKVDERLDGLRESSMNYLHTALEGLY